MLLTYPRKHLNVHEKIHSQGYYAVVTDQLVKGQTKNVAHHTVG